MWSPRILSAHRSFALGLLMLAGCDALTYSPDEAVPVTEVDPTPGELVVDLATPSDTLGLWGRIAVPYTVDDSRSGLVQRAEVEIGGRVYEVTPGSPARIATTDLADGVYTFRLRAYASSGTGSLADVYGRERVVAEVVRPAVVDNAPPGAVAVQALDPESGLLTVRWARYARFNFREYRVYAEGDRGRELRAVVADRDSTEWRDHQFVGGTARYHVEVVSGDGRVARGNARERTFRIPSFIEATGDLSGEISLVWSSTSFPAALERYEVVKKGLGTQTTSVLSTRDTMASFPLSDDFGLSHRFLLATHAGGDRPLRSPEVEVWLDPASGMVGHVSAVPGLGAVFGVDAETRQPLLKAATSLDVLVQGALPRGGEAVHALSSRAGRLGVVYLRAGTYSGALLDPATLDVEREVALEPFIGDGSRPDLGEFGWPALTDDGVLFYGANPRSFADYVGPTIVGVDLSTGTLAASFGDRVGPLAVMAASGNGQYVLLGVGGNHHLYERDTSAAGGYSPVREFDRIVGPILRAAFVGPSRVAVVYEGFQESEIRVYELPSLDLVESVAIPPSGEIGDLFFDPASGLLAYVLSGDIFFVDPAEPGPLRAIPTDVVTRHAFAAGAVWGRGRYRRLFPIR